MRSFEAISMCVGRDSDLVADVLGRKPITVRRWKQDPTQSGTPNPLDTIEKMIKVALESGKPNSEALAPLNYLISCFSSHSSPISSIHESFADVQLEASHLGMEYSTAVRDNRISADEARRLNREIAHLEGKLAEMKAVIEESRNAQA